MRGGAEQRDGLGNDLADVSEAQHQTRQQSVAIGSTPVNWILDADIKGFFDEIDQTRLVRFLEHRIGDERVIRLVRKWLRGAMERQ